MDFDLRDVSRFLSRPIRSVEVALPTHLGGKWRWPPKVRTNFVAIRSDAGTMLFHYGLVLSNLLDGLEQDNPWEGHIPKGTISIFGPGDVESERVELALPRPFQSPETLEMIPLDVLFPDAGPIFVHQATVCEVSYAQTIRDGVFCFDVSGIRIYSPEASTLLEPGSGGTLECSVQS